MRRVVTWSGVLAVVAACSGGSVTIDEFPTEYRRALCEYVSRCEWGGVDDSRCEKNLGELDTSLAQLVASVRAGKVRYDGSRVRTCLDAVAKSPCTRSGLSDAATAAACDEALQGTVAAGGACFDGNECAGRGRCAKQMCPPAPACCAGVCQARPAPAAVGAPCTFSSDCVPEAYCPPGAVGAARTCRARLALGAACMATDECVAGAICRGDPGAMKCAALSKDGESCTTTSQCADTGSFCSPADRKCKPLPRVGEACPDNVCISAASCLSGTCRARPGVGEMCMAAPDGGAPATTLRCLSGTCTGGVCTAPPARPACM